MSVVTRGTLIADLDDAVHQTETKKFADCALNTEITGDELAVLYLAVLRDRLRVPARRFAQMTQLCAAYGLLTPEGGAPQIITLEGPRGMPESHPAC